MRNQNVCGLLPREPHPWLSLRQMNITGVLHIPMNIWYCVVLVWPGSSTYLHTHSLTTAWFNSSLHWPKSHFASSGELVGRLEWKKQAHGYLYQYTTAAGMCLYCIGSYYHATQSEPQVLFIIMASQQVLLPWSCNKCYHYIKKLCYHVKKLCYHYIKSF